MLPRKAPTEPATTIADEVIVHDAALRDQPELDEVLDAVHIAMERGFSLGSLESSERRATALLEAIPDSMYRVDADGTFIEFRLSDTARLPIDADDLVGLNVRDVLSPEASDDVFAAMKRAAANDTVEVVNYTLDFPGDSRRHLEARIVKSGHDESVAIVRDITDRTLQQHALETLVEEQAALSRVAVAVATATRPEVLFDVVTEEVARLLGRRRRQPRPLRPCDGRGRDRRQVERAGRPDSRCRNARRPARRRARARLQNRPPRARGRPRSRELTRARSRA